MAHGAAMVIEVLPFGQPLFLAALNDTTPDNARWAQRKARTVEYFRSSSYALTCLETLQSNTRGARHHPRGVDRKRKLGRKSH